MLDSINYSILVFGMGFDLAIIIVVMGVIGIGNFFLLKFSFFIGGEDVKV